MTYCRHTCVGDKYNDFIPLGLFGNWDFLHIFNTKYKKREKKHVNMSEKPNVYIVNAFLFSAFSFPLLCVLLPDHRGYKYVYIKSFITDRHKAR